MPQESSTRRRRPRGPAACPGAPAADVSATIVSTRARRSALASTSASASGSPPGRRGTVGSPSVTHDDERHGVRMLDELLAEQQPRARGARRRAASGPRAGSASSRRVARARGSTSSGSATVASGTPPLNATSATWSPRRGRVLEQARTTTPFTFSTIRSAWTDQLLSTTKQTANGERCSRTLRRRSSGSTRSARRPPRIAAARSVASNATSASPRPGEPVARVLALAEARRATARAGPTRAALEPVAPRRRAEDRAGVDLELGRPPARPRRERRRSSAYARRPGGFFSVDLRRRAPPRAAARRSCGSSLGGGRERVDAAAGGRARASAASTTSSALDLVAAGERGERLRALERSSRRRGGSRRPTRTTSRATAA